MISSEDGVKPYQKKITDLVDAPIPNNASGVRSLLGMANVSAKFIPNFADITEPLRRLTHKNTVFKWEKEQSQAFKKLKEVLTDSPVMTYFDIEKETYLIVDASSISISAILAQSSKDEPQKVIAYASGALTPVERR